MAAHVGVNLHALPRVQIGAMRPAEFHYPLREAML
jgi:hypothetical protein